MLKSAFTLLLLTGCGGSVWEETLQQHDPHALQESPHRAQSAALPGRGLSGGLASLVEHARTRPPAEHGGPGTPPPGQV